MAEMCILSIIWTFLGVKTSSNVGRKPYVYSVIWERKVKDLNIYTACAAMCLHCFVPLWAHTL